MAKATFGNASQRTGQPATCAFVRPDGLTLSEMSVQFGPEAEKLTEFEIPTMFRDLAARKGKTWSALASHCRSAVPSPLTHSATSLRRTFGRETLPQNQIPMPQSSLAEAEAARAPLARRRAVVIAELFKKGSVHERHAAGT